MSMRNGARFVAGAIIGGVLLLTLGAELVELGDPTSVIMMLASGTVAVADHQPQRAISRTAARTR